MERKLAAIFSADVQGYSRLMGDDEEATIRTLTTYREVLSNQIVQHQGRVVDSPGDNLLAEFASVVQAVQCAVAVQRDLARRNADLPTYRIMAFRIGINLGDVIAEDNRLYGDGVNIAARLEGLAEGGGVCISGTAYDQVDTKLDLAFDDLGEQRVKNIAKPVRVYQLRMDSEMADTPPAAPRATAKRWRWPVLTGAAVVIVGVISLLVWRTPSRGPMPTPTRPPHAAISTAQPDKPSIAVLPFSNMSGDQEQAYFADGMTDDLITDLSKLSGLFVIASNSVFTYKGQAVKIPQVAEELGVRYVIEGSVRRAGETIRINAQLIDATSGGHLWAETFDRPYQDIFTVQDEVTARIVRALQVKLTDIEQAQLMRRPTSSLKAYELFLQAENFYNNDRHRDILKKALALYEQAVSLDPEFSEAQAGLAVVTYMVALTAARDILPPAVALKRFREALERALALNPYLPQALSLKSLHHWWKGDFDEAVEFGARAVASGPNNAVVRSRFATLLVHTGRHEEAAAALETTLRLEPHPSVLTLSHIGRTLYHLRQYERATGGGAFGNSYASRDRC